MTYGSRIQAGAVLAPQNLSDIHGEQFRIPDPRLLIHLQFRRFAGCPVCDLHLHSIVGRRQEISMAGIREVVVFHSSVADVVPYAADLPFAVIADPARRLYSAFGVERGPRALLDQGAWLPVIKGVFRSIGLVLRGKQPIPPPESGGR